MRFCSKLLPPAAFLAALAATAFAAENSIPEPAAPPPSASPRVASVVRADARTGRLVRSIVVAPRPVLSRVVAEQSAPGEPAASREPAQEVRGLVEQAARNFDVSPLLVDSVIQVESNYNPYAVSPKGAQGLMQLMPATARRFGVKNTFDARQNIEGGVRYLKLLQETFKDDRLAIAAYNAGEAAVTKYGNVPPYAETMDYVAKVGKKYGQAKRAADKNKPAAKAAENPSVAENAKPAEPEPRHIVQYLDAEGRLHIATR